MQNFVNQITESQEKLLMKTIEEQRKLDKEMFSQYNNIFLQQTQMLLTGLQNLSSPSPQNYATFQQFSGVTTMPAVRPMFTENLNQSYPTQPTFSHQNNINTDHSCTSHETQTRLRSHQAKTTISRIVLRENEDVEYLDTVERD
nr:PREDICTED: uncharacterized protein LOC100879135 isoform X1 [Megachile rotundata]